MCENILMPWQHFYFDGYVLLCIQVVISIYLDSVRCFCGLLVLLCINLCWMDEKRKRINQGKNRLNVKQSKVETCTTYE